MVEVVIDVNQVVQKHHKIMPNLLAAHALTGCDTVSCFSGIGKATVYKKLESFDDHIKLGDLSACLDEVTESCMGFVASLNGHAQGNALEAMRAEIFTWKPLAKGTSQQNLKVFLPQWRLSDPIVHVPIIKQHYGKPRYGIPTRQGPITEWLGEERLSPSASVPCCWTRSSTG